MSEHKKYYSHNVLTADDGRMVLLTYDFWQTFSPKLHKPTTHLKRDAVTLNTPEELTQWVSDHPEHEEAPPIAFDRADWEPYFAPQRRPPMPHNNDKLDEILEAFRKACVNKTPGPGFELTKESILDLFDEMVGPDETVGDWRHPNAGGGYRNRFRADLHAKIEELRR